MALGLLLWVSCVSLLLNFSVGLSNKKAYRVIEDSNNLKDDRDDDALNSEEQDQVSNEHPAGVGLGTYNHPFFAQWQALLSTHQNQPTTPSVLPAVQKAVTAAPSRWLQQSQPTKPSVPPAQRPVIYEQRRWWQHNKHTTTNVPAVQEPAAGHLNRWPPQNRPNVPSSPTMQEPAAGHLNRWLPQNQPNVPSSPTMQEPAAGHLNRWPLQSQPNVPSSPTMQEPAAGHLNRWLPQNQPNVPTSPTMQEPAAGQLNRWPPQNQPNVPSTPTMQEPAAGQLNRWPPQNQPNVPSSPTMQEPAAGQLNRWPPQNQPNVSTSPTMQEPATSGWRGFRQQNLHRPLVFPLRPNQPAAPQPPNQGVPITPSGIPTNSQPVYPSGGDADRYVNGVPSHQPVSSPPVQEPWMPGPVNEHHGVPQPSLGFQHQGFNSPWGDDSSSHPNLVFERVFQLPPNNVPYQGFDATSQTAARQGQANFVGGSSAGHAPTAQQQPPSNAAVLPLYNFRRGLSAPFYSMGGHFNAMKHPRNQAFRTHRVMPVQRARPVQSVSQPTASRQHRPTYIFRSRNRYQRGRVLYAQSSYKPEYQDTNSMTSVTGFQEPPESQPPAPKA